MRKRRRGKSRFDSAREKHEERQRSKMIIDSHCHLSDERLKERIGEIVENFEDEGIEGVVEVGFDLPSSKNAVKLSEKYKKRLCRCRHASA